MPDLTGALAWPALPFVGPQIQNTVGRSKEKYRLCENETPSLANLTFPDPTASPTNEDILVRRPRKSGGVKVEVTPNELTRLTDPVELIKSFAESVELLAQRRIAAFYQQLILAFCTRLHFEEGKTVDQAESAQQRKLVARGQQLTVKTDASHSNTIPALYAYPLDEWEAYKASLATAHPLPKPAGFVYLKGSDGYAFWNSTLEMPKSFNTGVDNSIDLGANGLRNAGIDLLNRAAKGQITPEDGLKEFHQKFLAIVRRTRAAAQAQGNQAKCEGLDLYRKELLEIQEVLDNDPSAFDHYLNLVVDPADQATDIRRTIYQIRYQAIQTNFSRQAEIAEKINTVKKRVLGQFARRPPYAEEAFRELVVNNATGANRNRFNKFFNRGYELRPNAGRQLAITRAKQAIENLQVTVIGAFPVQRESGQLVIKRLTKEVERMMTTMRANEIEKRGPITRTLRKMRGWTQKDLSREIQTYFPRLPSSQSTISRCETGVRMIDSDYASKLGKAFKVDSALFMPQFFNE